MYPVINAQKKTNPMRLGTLNVRNLCSGIGNDLTGLDNSRKTAVVDRELSPLKVDIADLQETRLAGSIKENNYAFYWAGVGFTVHNRLLHSITIPVAVSERTIYYYSLERTQDKQLSSVPMPLLSTLNRKLRQCSMRRSHT